MSAIVPGCVRLCLALTVCTATGASAQRFTSAELYHAKNGIAELVQQGSADSALSLLRRITVQDSADAIVWRQLGQLAMEKRLWPEAAGAFEQAYELGAFGRGLSALQAAGAHAAAGRATKALDLLELAFANRLQGPERVIEDPSFLALRDSARLRAIYSNDDAASLSRDEKWRRDIDFFLREAQRMHAHPDRPAHSPAFVNAIADLRARVPDSSDMSLRLGLRRIVTMLGDGHSSMLRDTAMRAIPIDLYLFSDGMFVIGGEGDAAAHTGSRVVAVGARPVEDVSRAVAQFISRDNEMTLRERLPAALVNASLLSEVGAANPDGSVNVTLEDRGGRRTVARFEAGPVRPYRGLRTPRDGTIPLYLERSDRFWVRDLPDAQALYLSFNAVANSDSLSLADFAEDLAVRLRTPSYRNLIVDVRLNGGGDTFLLPPLIRAITSFAVGDAARRVYVITGRRTFSAAQNFTAKLEWLLNPVFVGEPTGSGPNFTGETQGTRLPYSGLIILISNRIHMNSDWEDARTWIAPDLATPLSSADYFAGRDPALEAILAAAASLAGAQEQPR